MRFVEHTLAAVHDHGWAHHNQRLIVLGNLSLLAGASAPGKTCVRPTPATLRDGSYPLSTRLILYANDAAAGTSEVRRAAAR